MKINYLKKSGNDGTVYNQTITIDKNIMSEFNDYVMKLKTIRQDKRFYTAEEMKIKSYLEILHGGKNYITLTTLDYFMKFYLKYIYEPPKKDKTYERIKWRNTIINVK